MFVDPKKYKYESDILDDINKYISKDPDCTYGIHFTGLQKVGINPRYPYNTPVGIYFYPIQDSHIKWLFASRRLPFAQERPYIALLKIKNNANILKIGLGSSEDRQDLHRKMSSLIFPNVEYERVSDDSFYMFTGRTKGMSFSEKTMALASCSTNQPIKRHISTALNLFKVGIDVAITYNNPIIHPNEKTQGVIINPTSFEVVKMYNNIDLFQSALAAAQSAKNVLEKLFLLKECFRDSELYKTPSLKTLQYISQSRNYNLSDLKLKLTKGVFWSLDNDDKPLVLQDLIESSYSRYNPLFAKFKHWAEKHIVRNIPPIRT